MSTSPKAMAVETNSVSSMPTENKTVTQKVPRRLREKVLIKAASTKSAKVSKASAKEKPTTPKASSDVMSKTIAAPQTKTPSPCSSRSAQSSVPDREQAEKAAEEIVSEWKQCRISPPRAIISDDEESVASAEAFLDAMSVGRPSMLVTSSKRMGVEMDMATRYANEMLLKGKEALEIAGNMKRESKVTALECMQALYETVLALSDSRSRHKFNLERERKRNATELVRVERAHNKTISELNRNLTAEVKEARKDLQNTLSETKAVRDWLGHETREPYENIQKTLNTTTDITKALKVLETRTEAQNPQCQEPLRKDHEGIKSGVASVQKQLDELRRKVEKSNEHQTQIQKTLTQTMAQIKTERAKTPPTEHASIKSLEEIKTLIGKINSEPRENVQAQQPINLKEHLQPIGERLEAVSSELRTMREEKLRFQAPTVPNLGAELTNAENAQTQSYAKVVARSPPPLKPNHTLIITSTDPKNTGEIVINKIKDALDTRTTGAKVDRVRKTKNQKVVLSCSSPEDLALVKKRVEQSKELKVEVARANNPLIIIKDVLSYHTDTEIIENILAQNKTITQDINLKETTIKIRFRKKARNQHECHPVLEVSPQLHKRLLEAEKLYIGLQRRPVFDHSPLVQCTKCLGYGHTKAICKEKEASCSYCSKNHTWENCPARKNSIPPTCKNCTQANLPGPATNHIATSNECRERQKWDAIARSRVSYC